MIRLFTWMISIKDVRDPTEVLMTLQGGFDDQIRLESLNLFNLHAIIRLINYNSLH